MDWRAQIQNVNFYLSLFSLWSRDQWSLFAYLSPKKSLQFSIKSGGGVFLSSSNWGDTPRRHICCLHSLNQSCFQFSLSETSNFPSLCVPYNVNLAISQHSLLPVKGSALSCTFSFQDFLILPHLPFFVLAVNAF